MKIESFTEIDSWKEARDLVSKIYSISSKNDFSKDYGLKDQIQRAAVSIMSNIAEGFDSGSNKMFISFLNYSYRSASEVESLLFVSLDLKYITEEEFKVNQLHVVKIKKLIGGFIKYLKNAQN